MSMRDYADIKNLCDELILGQENYVRSHPEREMTENMQGWLSGRESAWYHIRDYCIREMLYRMDEEERDYLAKLEQDQ